MLEVIQYNDFKTKLQLAKSSQRGSWNKWCVIAKDSHTLEATINLVSETKQWAQFSRNSKEMRPACLVDIYGFPLFEPAKYARFGIWNWKLLQRLCMWSQTSTGFFAK